MSNNPYTNGVIAYGIYSYRIIYSEDQVCPTHNKIMSSMCCNDNGSFILYCDECFTEKQILKQIKERKAR